MVKDLWQTPKANSYKSRSHFVVLVLLFTFMIISCARVLEEPKATLGPAEKSWAEETLNKMTLEEKIGQMVVCRYSGLFVNRDSDYLKRLESLIVKGKIGGLI